MNTKFTPGPWRYCPTNNGHMIGGSGNGYIAEARQIRDVPETKANAHLIAAAPDLYNALATIENDDGHIPAFAWDLRNAALAKARGES